MFDLKMFTLLNRLDAGERASARLLQWDGQRYVPHGPVIRVHDHLGHFGVAGEKGQCFLSPESGEWEVFNGLSRQAAELRAL